VRSQVSKTCPYLYYNICRSQQTLIAAVQFWPEGIIKVTDYIREGIEENKRGDSSKAGDSNYPFPHRSSSCDRSLSSSESSREELAICQKFGSGEAGRWVSKCGGVITGSPQLERLGLSRPQQNRTLNPHISNPSF
jgi:hypothetical protein